MTDTLYRTAALQTDGRTISGIAVPFGRPSLVSDQGGPPYREGFHRTSFNRALSHRGDKPFPLRMMHAGAPGFAGDPTPLGPVTFRATRDALEFEGRMSKTRAADEALELLADGILGDVSIGFNTFRSRALKDADGPWIERQEAAPVELSLAIVGHGLYPGAQVLAVRAAASLTSTHETGTPRLDALRRRRALLVIP